MKPKRARSIPLLDDDSKVAVLEALAELAGAEFETPSDAESAADSLASVLREAFFTSEKDIFWDRTPTLFEVIVALSSEYVVPAALTDAALELESFAEDSYQEEFDEDVLREIGNCVEEFCAQLKAFLDGKSAK